MQQLLGWAEKMKTETKVLGIIFILTIVILFGGVFLLSRGSPAPVPTAEGPILQIDYSKGQKIGSDSAKVRLVEFSDFECPACLAAEPAVRSIREKYTDQEVQLIYRHFPLPQHKYGREAAYLAEAAGEEGKFWEMHARLFETQTEWSGLSDVTPFFIDLAKQLGLNERKAREAITGDVFKSRIEDDLNEGRRLGVNSTPTFYLNGRKLNLQNFNDLVTLVDEELKK